MNEYSPAHIRCVKKLTGCFFLVISIFFAWGQTNKIDSLRIAIGKSENNPEAQKELVMQMCEQNFSLPADSVLKYVNLGKKLFPVNSSDYFKISNFYFSYLFKRGELEQAILLADSMEQKISEIRNHDKVLLQIMTYKGSALIRNNQNKEGLEQSFKLLETAEKSRDTTYVIRAYILLGWANMELEKNNDALSWLNKGYRYSTNEDILKKETSLFSNMASCYNNINKPDSAFYFINLALKYSREVENLTTLANALNIRAAMYLKDSNFNGAENDMNEALHTREQIGDVLYIVSDLAQLSFFYSSIKKYDKGIESALKGIALARSANNISKLIFLYTALAENYQKSGKMDECADALQSIIYLKDTLYNKNSEEAIAEIQGKYELQKKENIIIHQNYRLARSRYFAIGAVVLLFLGSFLLWALYRNYQLVQQRKMQSAIAEQKLLGVKAIQRAEENERKRIAADLHDNLGSYAAAITSNVKYLKDSEEGSIELMTQLDENAQSMVTQLSDTIWILKNEHLPITKLADRFKIWMQPLMKNYPHIKYYYTEEIINDIEFTPSKILHIFLILKECVNNALKHSGCTDLKINFFTDNGWTIIIEDNGKGMNQNHGKGSGIDNIMMRTVECGWNVTWKNVLPHGTRIEISGSTTK